MSTRRLLALSNLGEIIMGNWRITGFTGAIFGLTESGGFRYSVCAYYSIYRHLYLIWRVSGSVSYGYLLVTYLPSISSQLALGHNPAPYALGLSYGPFVLFSTYSDLILVNVPFTLNFYKYTS